MTLDYLSLVCGWNLKQMMISFPLGTIQLLRLLYLWGFFLFPCCLLLFLLSVLSVRTEVAERSHLRATGLSGMPVGTTCCCAGSGSSQALSLS